MTVEVEFASLFYCIVLADKKCRCLGSYILLMTSISLLSSFTVTVMNPLKISDYVLSFASNIPSRHLLRFYDDCRMLFKLSLADENPKDDSVINVLLN